MKSLMLVTGLTAILLIAPGCSSTAPANSSNTATTNTTNSAARPANASNTSTANSASTTANTSSSPSSSTAEGGDQDFTLVNSTGVEIDKVYISPHDKDDWEEDILGRDTLPNGQNVEVKFHRDEKAAMWDLRVEDKQGNAIEWENLNLLEISKLTLHYENGKARADVE